MSFQLLGVVESVSYITGDQRKQLLAFDYAIHWIQLRIPLLLAALALVRDIFGGHGTKCYPPPEYVTESEVVEYFNSYCIYEENENLTGYHEFIPFTFTIQAVLTQIPVILWIAGGGKKISMVAKWFSKCCRDMCSEAEALHQTREQFNDQTDNKASNKDWPKVYSILQSYITEWSDSNKSNNLTTWQMFLKHMESSSTAMICCGQLA
ncbi:uncharacterized protein LOC117107753 isoform X2 [Anneissia japonica]|uniref:uncharacterized protein LOC117107753 isoform X2 n=1 Tax=Anneissia japonica TaxID=1529436 RepID=UPI0014255AC1|nr:uncharacterized protein LOC117107753 isoform X2 [Anneissia japonica]